MHRSEENHDLFSLKRELVQEETTPSLRKLSSLDIVMQLQNILGSTIGGEISKLVLTEDISTIVVWGVPGSGKTTVIEGIIQLLRSTDRKADARRRDEDRTIEIEVVSFDKIRQMYFQRLRTMGRDVWALKDLTDEERDEFDNLLSEAMTGPLPAPTKPYAKVIRLVEVPAVGDELYPRGQTGMRILGARAKNERSALKTISIHVLADAPVYVMAQMAREIATQCKDDHELKSRLYPLVTYLGSPEPDDVGKNIWLTRFQGMASSNQILSILNEFDARVADANIEWERNSQNKMNGATITNQQKMLSVHEMYDFIKHTNTIPAGSEEDRLQIIKRYVYVIGVLSEMFGFPDARSFMVAVNTAVYGDSGRSLR